MSVIIKLSYESDWELDEVARRLQQPGMKLKHAGQKGQYRRAYIKISTPDIDKTKNFRYNNVEQTFAK